MTLLEKGFTRFLLSGVLNTSVTYMLYLFLLHIMRYNIAYTIVFLVGIVFSYFLNSFFVFKVRLTFLKMLIFPLVYFGQYLLGLVILHISIHVLYLSSQVGGVLVIVLLVPVTYSMNRFVFIKVK
jgi:putative flippase GtrA